MATRSSLSSVLPATSVQTKTIQPNPYASNPALASAWEGTQQYNSQAEFLKKIKEQLQSRYDERVGNQLRSQQGELINKLYNTANNYYAENPDLTTLSPAQQQALIDQRAGMYMGQLAANKSAQANWQTDIGNVVKSTGDIYAEQAKSAQDRFNAILAIENQKRTEEVAAKQAKEAQARYAQADLNAANSLAESKRQFDIQEKRLQQTANASASNLLVDNRAAAAEKMKALLPMIKKDIYGEYDSTAQAAIQQYNYYAEQAGMPTWTLGRKVARSVAPAMIASSYGATDTSGLPPVLPNLGPDAIVDQAFLNKLSRVTDMTSPQAIVYVGVKSGKSPQQIVDDLTVNGAKTPEDYAPVQAILRQLYGKNYTPGAGAGQTDKFAQVQSKIVSDTIDRIIPTINDWNTGLAANTEWIKGTPAYQLREDLSTIESAIGLGRLQAMKEASKSGASGFGSLSAPELKLLVNSLGSINAGIGKEALVRNLMIIKEGMAKLDAGPDPMGALPPALPSLGGSNMVRVLSNGQTYVMTKEDAILALQEDKNARIIDGDPFNNLGTQAYQSPAPGVQEVMY